jgi:cytochrome c-type biogenesis protein CcmH/NrfG
LNQKTLAVVAVVVAVAAGAYWLGTRSSSSQVAPPVPVPAAGMPFGAAPPGSMPPGAMPPGSMPPGAQAGEIQQRLAIGEQLVQRDPKNPQAWAMLGNDYFDAQQPQKAVDAYAKALALKPDDPDVLTDQGVMYRALGKYDQALANFEKASKLDPRHVQSVFNVGIVYGYDLHQTAKATAAFEKVIQMAPGSPQAVQARQHLASLAAQK